MNIFDRIKVGHALPMVYIAIVLIQLNEGEVVLAIISALILGLIFYSHLQLGSDSFFHQSVKSWIESNAIAGVFFVGFLVFAIYYVISILVG